MKGFYLEYRALLTSDVVHLNRRADGQGLDAILHVNPLLGSSSSGDDDTTGNGNSNGNGNGGSALLVVFNPTDADVAMSGPDVTTENLFLTTSSTAKRNETG